MSESNPIEYNELFGQGAWEKAIENVDLFTERIKIAEQATTTFAKSQGKILQKSGNVISLEDYKKENDAITKLNATYEVHTKLIQQKLQADKQKIAYAAQVKKAAQDEANAEKQKAAAIKAAAAEQEKATKLTREQIQVAKLQEKANTSAAGSYNQLSAKLGLAQIELKKMSAQERDGTEAGKLLTNQVATYQAKLTELDSKVGVYSRNVGNYSGHLVKLGRGIGGVTELAGTLGTALGIDTTMFQNLEAVGRTFIKVSKELSHTEELEEIVTKKQTASKIENTTVTEENTVVTDAQTEALKAEALATKEAASSQETLSGATEETGVASTEAAAPMGILNTIMEANPVLLIVVGFIALAAAVYGLVKLFESTNTSMEAYIAEAKKQQEITDELEKSTKRQVDLMEKEGAATDDIIKVKKKLLEQEIKNEEAQLLATAAKEKDALTNFHLGESLQDYLDKVKTLSDEYKKEQDALKDFQEQLKENTLDEGKALDDLIAKIQEMNQADWQNQIDEADKTYNEISKNLLSFYENGKLSADEYYKQLADLDSGHKKQIAKILSDEAGNHKKNNDTKLADDKLYYEKTKELDEQFNAPIKDSDIVTTTDDKADTLLSEQKAAADALLAAKKEEADALKDIDKTITDDWKAAIDSRYNYQKDKIQAQTSLIDSQLTLQESRFEKGLSNTLAFEQKQRNDAALAAIKADQKHKRQQSAEELGQLFLKLAEANASEGMAGIAKASRETLLAKGMQAGIIAAFGGSAFEGIEDTGGAGTLDNKGGKAWILHPHERVLDRENNERLGGISNDELVDFALAGFYQQQYNSSLQIKSPEEKRAQETRLLYELNLSMKSVEKTIRDKKEITYSTNFHGEIIRHEVENGISRIITQKKNKW